MTRADIDETIGDSNPEKENATGKGINEGETEMVDNPILDTGLENNMSLVLRKPVFGVSDLVRHKQGCTTTQDG